MHRGNVNQAGRPTCICADPLGCQVPTKNFVCRLRLGCTNCGNPGVYVDAHTGNLVCVDCRAAALELLGREVTNGA